MRNLFELLDFRARFDPEGVAAVRPGRSLTFAQMRHMTRAIARMLRHAGVQPGQLVVTALADRGTDWVVTLALFHEGAISCSQGGYTPWRASFGYDWLVTDRNWTGPRGPNVIFIDEVPIPQDKLDAFERIDHGGEECAVRLFLTSGTTGLSKGVPLTLGQLLGRARASMFLPGGRRILSALGMSTASDFNAALVSLMVGSPHYVFPLDRICQLVREHDIDCVTGSPSTLAPLVQQASAGPRPDCIKTIRVVGAAAPAALVRGIRAKIGARVVNYYGSTEAGGIAAVHAAAEGDPVAGFAQIDARIEIVDGDGAVLPVRGEGLVRTRTPFMASGYWQDEAETAKAFRDGWFYPGDRGWLREDGALVLSGREGEILNVAGLKVNPVLMDHALAEWPGVRDGAVFAAKASLGDERVVACLVADGEVDTAALSAALAARFGGGATPAVYLRIGEVPRNAMGKVMRAELAQQLASGALKPV